MGSIRRAWHVRSTGTDRHESCASAHGWCCAWWSWRRSLIAVDAVAQAQAAGPAWSLHVAGADRVAPGSTFEYRLSPRNVGDADTDGTVALDVTLPSGITGVSVRSGLTGRSLPILQSPGRAAIRPARRRCTATVSIPFPISARRAGAGTPAPGGRRGPGASGHAHLDFQAVRRRCCRPGRALSQAVDASPTPDFEIKAFDGAVLRRLRCATYTQAAGIRTRRP